MPTVTNNVGQVGMAWTVQKDSQTALPHYTFNLSVAAVNQVKADATGNINLLVKRLPAPDKQTKATHQLYMHDPGKQVFDETSELLISVNRKKVKDCFLLNGFFYFKALPQTPKSVYKKLNAYTYQIKEDRSFTNREKKDGPLPIIGYAYLKVQADLDPTGEVIGKMITTSGKNGICHNLYIQKERVLDQAAIDQEYFYVIARKDKDTQNEYRLYFSSILNYQEVDFVFFFNRKAFMRLGWSDNNGNVIFVAYTRKQKNTQGGDLELYYVHYNPENMIREQSTFISGKGWSAVYMDWLTGE